VLRTISRIKLKLSIRMDWLMLFGRGHFSWHRRPKKLEDWERLPILDKNADYSRVAIVMQGVVEAKNSFTLQTLRLYKYFYPGAILILSTWSDISPHRLIPLKNLGVRVVLSDPMESSLRGNFSRQVQTSLKGIDDADSQSADYVLKVRTDQCLYAQTSIKHLRSLMKLFPLEPKTTGPKGRILFLCTNTFVDRPTGASDFMQFGNTEDVKRFWLNALKYDLPEDITPEQTVTASYLLSLGWDRETIFSNETWVRAMKEVFGFVDASSLDFFWYKYSMREYFWRRYQGPPLQEMTQAHWIGIMASEID
jgi:hypothetical protein